MSINTVMENSPGTGYIQDFKLKGQGRPFKEMPAELPEGTSIEVWATGPRQRNSAKTLRQGRVDDTEHKNQLQRRRRMENKQL